MGTLISSGTIESIREIWWDIRPHPGFGTVELRICDGLPTLQEVGALAALSQCLVDQLNTQLDRGYRLPPPKGWLVRENKWRAARYGLAAEVIVDEFGTTRPLRDAIAELVDDLHPLARRLGCADGAGGRPDDPRRGAELPAAAPRGRRSRRRPAGRRRQLARGDARRPAAAPVPADPSPAAAAS